MHIRRDMNSSDKGTTALRVLLVAAAGAGLLAGCSPRLAREIPAYPSPGKLEADTRVCEQAATADRAFTRRTEYMACMIARGYRTQVFAATYWRMAELQVVARRGQAQDRVFSDLQGCASTNGAVAGARPLEIAGAVDWVNARFGRDGQARDRELAALVAHCLIQQGYAAEPIARARE
jgi:hypothetical protein